MRLERYHGLGNDYLVLASGEPVDAPLVTALCDRHTGVGSDGLLEPRRAADADHGVRIWNPDGSVAEKSGNGLRILAQWLVDDGRAVSPFTVSTGHDVVRCAVGPAEVEVAMGTARFEPEAVPTTGATPWLDHPIEAGADTVSVCAVSMGNPHAVVFVEDDLQTIPWRRWGQALETHPAFPQRTNVQVARVHEGRVDIRIWERGAGETQASGSSSCAVVAAAVRTGRLQPGTHTVHMPGGSLTVALDAAFGVTLTGPVERIGAVEVDERWVAARR